MNDQQAPRVTMEDIKANIVSEHYFTAEDAQASDRALDIYRNPKDEFAGDPSLALLTFCVLVLRNGFTVVGKSACVSPDNFNPRIGREIAHDDAINQCWPLMGYALAERLSH